MRWVKSLRHVGRLPEVLRCLKLCRHPLPVIFRYIVNVHSAQYPYRISLRNGLSLELLNGHDLVTAWIVFFRREYRVPEGSATILDLGANIGCFSLFSAMQLPAVRIVAVEPYPPTFARLQANLRAHGLEQRVTCWEVGIAAEAGERSMSGERGPSQTVGIMPLGEVGESAIKTKVLSFAGVLEKACTELKTEQIDFVKIDIEGAEHEAFASCSDSAFQRIRRLGMEYHPNGPKQRLFDRLLSTGFHLEHDQVFGANIGVAHFAR